MVKNSIVQKLKPETKKIIWRVSIGFLGFYLLWALVFGIGIYGFRWDSEVAYFTSQIFPYPAAVVNYKHFVSTSEFLNDLAALKQYYKQAQGVDFASTEGRNKLKGLRKDLINQLVEEKIMRLEAKNYGITISDAEFQEEYSNIVKANGGEEQLRKQVKDYYNWTLDEFKERVKFSILQKKLDQRISEDERINEEERKKAEEALAQAKGGADFKTLVAQYSEDPATAQNDGDLGFISKGALEASLEEAAFSLKKGEVYPEVIKTKYGYYIIKCTARKNSQVRISAILVRVKDFNDWLEAKKQEYVIWYFLKG